MLKIFDKLQLNGAGVAYGSTSATSRLYATDAIHVEGFAGKIHSSLYSNRFYFIYPDMDIQTINLGDPTYLQ